MALENIPHELRTLPQWVRRDANKRPLNPRTGALASPTNPNDWGTWPEAAASSFGVGVGFVFTDNDPYTGIDLDVAEGEAPTEEQQAIYNEFDSYAERSPSGHGLHIIVKGKVPAGRRQKGIEVYSSGRYFTMTGDTERPGPINDHSAKLQTLWARMGSKAPQAAQDAPDAAQTASDGAIVDQARNAANGAKFATLYAGNWQGEYPSQSEADQALINIIAFYTKNREQVTRIFRASALGQRDKAKRDDYVAKMLAKAFDRELQTIDFSPLIRAKFIWNKEKPDSDAFEEYAEAINKKPRFNPITAAIIEATPSLNWRVKYVLPATGIAAIYGASASGKSFVGLELAAAIAEGSPFFGYTAKPAAVLYVVLEGEGGIRGRVLAWQRYKARAMPSDMRFLLQPFRLNDSQDVAELAAMCPPPVASCLLIP